MIETDKPVAGFWSYKGRVCVECFSEVGFSPHGHCYWCRGSVHHRCSTLVSNDITYVSVCKGCLEGD